MKFKKLAYLTMPLLCFGMLACGGNKTSEASGSGDSDSVAVDSANEEVEPVAVQKFAYDKSNKYATIAIEVNIPTGTDDASAEMRNVLLAVVDEIYAQDEEGTRTTPKYKGDKSDVKKCITYYGAHALTSLAAESKENSDDMQVDDESAESEEGGEAMEAQQYEKQLTITKEKYETSSVVAFTVQTSAYYGGAHPGSTAYSITFDKKTGKQFKNFFVSGAKTKMQSLFRKGLVKYFKDNGESVNERNLGELLQIEGKTIPMPTFAPCPSKNGLIFTYQQYEIASYAEGMPSFVIPYTDVAPYLTAEAKALLGL